MRKAAFLRGRIRRQGWLDARPVWPGLARGGGDRTPGRCNATRPALRLGREFSPRLVARSAMARNARGLFASAAPRY